MAAAGTVATLLPGAFLVLGETQRPPIELLRQYGVPMAVASDANPGTSPLFLPTLLAQPGLHPVPPHPTRGPGRHDRPRARALGQSQLGRIAQGQPADLCLWDVRQPAELAYRCRPVACASASSAVDHYPCTLTAFPWPAGPAASTPSRTARAGTSAFAR